MQFKKLLVPLAIGLLAVAAYVWQFVNAASSDIFIGIIASLILLTSPVIMAVVTPRIIARQSGDSGLRFSIEDYVRLVLQKQRWILVTALCAIPIVVLFSFYMMISIPIAQARDSSDSSVSSGSAGRPLLSVDSMNQDLSLSALTGFEWYGLNFLVCITGAGLTLKLKKTSSIIVLIGLELIVMLLIFAAVNSRAILVAVTLPYLVAFGIFMVIKNRYSS
jgi:hypothetical protein